MKEWLRTKAHLMKDVPEVNSETHLSFDDTEQFDVQRHDTSDVRPGQNHYMILQAPDFRDPHLDKPEAQTENTLQINTSHLTK